MAFWHKIPKGRVTEQGEDLSTADRIAVGQGRSAPSDLFQLAMAESTAGRLGTALEILCKVTDRNHDFASALPGMTGRTPLRLVVYNPLVSGLMVEVVDRISGSGNYSGAAGQVDRGLHVLDNEWSQMFSISTPAYWGLFLSDAAALREMQFRHLPGGKLDDAQIYNPRFLVEHAARIDTRDLTVRGQSAIRYHAERAAISCPSLAPPRGMPTLAEISGLPCGALITQDEIRGWIKPIRHGASEATGQTWRPTKRTPVPRPRGLTAEALHQRAIWEGVSHTHSDPNGWWVAIDLAIYRWELSPTFVSSQFQLVRDVAYDLYAARERRETPRTPEWSWDTVLEMFEFVEAKLKEQFDSSANLAPLEFREIFSNILWFSTFRLDCLEHAGRFGEWYALAPAVNKALAEANPQFLTASQAHFVRNFDEILRRGPKKSDEL